MTTIKTTLLTASVATLIAFAGSAQAQPTTFGKLQTNDARVWAGQPADFYNNLEKAEQANSPEAQQHIQDLLSRVADKVAVAEPAETNTLLAGNARTLQNFEVK